MRIERWLAFLALGLLLAPAAAGFVAPAADAPASTGTTRILAWFDSEESLLAFAPSIVGREGFRLQSLPILAFAATDADLARLAQAKGLVRVEEDRMLPLQLATATTATRARAVWGSLLGGPISDPVTGQTIDGSGVGVAVVDTGIDALHPDLDGQVARNFKVVSGTVFWDILVDRASNPTHYVELPVTDEQGHGTHVAGIVAGSGAASNGEARGVAPGARLYGFGSNVGLHMWQTAAAYDWVLQNHDKVSPPVRVVTNSYGCATAYDPDSVTSTLVNMLIARGIVVTWSAGNGDTLNDGGTGADDRVNGCAKSPTPGLIGVANYDDQGTGTRDGVIAPSSSRGLATDPTTWPDVAAPGSDIHAPLSRIGLSSWTSKPIDAFATVYGGPNANPFGAMVNQHAGTAAFRFDGATSSPQSIDWILYTKPAAIYNAHTARWVTTSGLLTAVDTDEVQRTRHACDGAPLSGAPVAPGDALVLTKASGTANPIKAMVVSPDCRAVQLTVSFPCPTCTAEVDLAATFPGAPRDGTWAFLPGRTVDPALDGASGPEASPFYVGHTGTSMASPHVAGVAALMLQANPDLTPAEVEEIIEATAYKLASGAPYQPDPRHPGRTSSFDKGHGLVDAQAAVLEALARR